MASESSRSSSFGVPFIDISRFEEGFLEELLPRIESLLRKTQFVGGQAVRDCEASLKEITGARYAIGCANGTDALQIALRSGGVGVGDTVLLPDMTFWATFEAIVNVGAKPVTVDVDFDTLHLTAALVEEAIDKFKPKALLLVHLYGWAAPEIFEIRKICAEKKVLLVEDCAQALGVSIKGQSLIQGAFVATTSFYPAKVLGASGDAGAIFTSDETFAKMSSSLNDHGRSDHYAHGAIGWNSRLGAYEATFLTHSAKHLAKRIESRRAVCAAYRDELINLPFKILAPASDVVENGYTSVGIVDPEIRPKLMESLSEKKIGCRVIYPGAMSEQPGAQKVLAGKIDHGQSQKISQSVLSLPVFAYMRDDEISQVVDAVKDFFKKR